MSQSYITLFNAPAYLPGLMVLHNLDHLFDRQHLSCVKDGVQPIPQPDDTTRSLNSGLMVIEPGRDSSADIMTDWPSRRVDA